MDAPWAMGRLAHVVGHGSARWLSMGCARLSGTRASVLGLVDETVKPGRLEARVVAFAARLKGMPAEGLAETKRLLNRMSPLLAPKWDAMANKAFQNCYSKPGARRAVAAFCRRRSKRS